MRRFAPAWAVCFLLGSCAGSEARYGAADPLPSWRAEPWQADPISTSGFESHPAFDERTMTLFFVRSSPSFSGWRILMSECRDGRWAEPRSPTFAADGVEADPFITPDGQTLYFISTRRENGVEQRELDIWRSRRRGAGWGIPERLPEPVNSAGAEWFPRSARDGWLYFGSDRPGGLGGTDIYRARQQASGWLVENLGPAVNGAGDEYEAEVSPDGRRMIIMADGDLYLARRTRTGWTPRQKLGPEINTPGLEVGPAFSPSGRSIMFARDFGKAALPSGGSGELMVAREGAEESWPAWCTHSSGSGP